MNILITGAAGGMGGAITQVLSGTKHRLLLQYHHALPASPKDSLLISADLVSKSAIQTLIESVKQAGGADIIIHCATLPIVNDNIWEKSWATFEQHLKIQVQPLLMLIHSLVPGMKKKHFGRIIALGSEYTVGRPPGKLADYITAKYALLGLVKSLAVELGPFGITANCVSPGLTATHLTRHLPRKYMELVATQTPRQQLTLPDDVANLVRFLCAPESGMISGENILINGGYTMR